MDTTNLLERLEPLHADAFGWARHCCSGDAHAAEEVLQTAYLRAAEGRAKFGEQSALKTWWFGVIRLTAMESRRRAAWRLQRLMDWFQNNAPAESTSHHEHAALPGNVEAHQLDALLAQLPARQREVLHLVFYQEMSLSEAAATMNISVGSARQHYDRAKRKLRDELQPPKT